MGRGSQGYRNSRRVVISTLVQQLCREEKVGFVDLWGCFVGRADMFMRDGLRLSGKGCSNVCRLPLKNSRQWHR